MAQNYKRPSYRQRRALLGKAATLTPPIEVLPHKFKTLSSPDTRVADVCVVCNRPRGNHIHEEEQKRLI